MQSLIALWAALALLAPATAHMSLSYPAPFRAAINPNVPQSAIDYTPTAPLSGASQFPCKGYQVDIGTPQGKATAQWTAGDSYNYTLSGSAVHGGGSAQLGLSYDSGKTWKVIHTYLGSTPNPNQAAAQTFDFTIPSDTPATTNGTIVAWLWYNVIGNREIYMSCASVQISAGSSTRSAPAVAFSSRPDLFVANLANGCTTVEGKEVQIPNPGPAPDVTTKYSITDNSGSFTGTCKAVDGIGGETGSSSSSPSNSAAPAASGASNASSIASSVISSVASPTEQPTTMATSVTSLYSIPGFAPSSVSTSSGVFATSAASSSAIDSSAPSASSSPVESSAPSSASGAPVASGTGSSSSGGLTVSEDGSCGPSIATCGQLCCSSYGFCGSSLSYCGTGCQEGFGQCGSYLNSTSSTASAPTGAKFRIRN